MTDADPQVLRSQADRLRQEADEAEARAQQAAERRAQMKPEWRVAELLHEHFAQIYPGAGGAMDGGDVWYYEIPTGRDAEARWMSAWKGNEHLVFVGMAVKLAEQWSVTLEDLEVMLTVLADMLKGRTMTIVRRKREEREVASIDYAAGQVRDALTKLVEKAKAR